MTDELRLPYLIQQNGGLSLNGPHIAGFAAMTRVFVGPGVVAGCDVMILATTPEVAAGIAAYLNEHFATPAAHVVMGQPPWYQNLTQGNTLEDIVPKVRAAPVVPVVATQLATWEALGSAPRRTLL